MSILKLSLALFLIFFYFTIYMILHWKLISFGDFARSNLRALILTLVFFQSSQLWTEDMKWQPIFQWELQDSKVHGAKLRLGTCGIISVPEGGPERLWVKVQPRSSWDTSILERPGLQDDHKDTVEWSWSEHRGHTNNGIPLSRSYSGFVCPRKLISKNSSHPCLLHFPPV